MPIGMGKSISTSSSVRLIRREQSPFNDLILNLGLWEYVREWQEIFRYVYCKTRHSDS
jgi:hypothetical protein